ncbi:MAG: copper resistance protein CopC [Gammaproteobacteria bacterium]
MRNQFSHWQNVARSLALITTLFGFLSTVQAHTGLKESHPADGAVMRAAPEQIRLQFTAAVNLVRFTVTDQTGSAIDLGFRPQSSTTDDYLLPVAHLGAGTYTVGWAAIGEDGHTVTGEFGFSVDPNAEEEHGGHHAEGGSHSH